MFYAPWCGHCKQMKPAYEKVATKLKETASVGRLAAVDATLEKELGKRFEVQGFPTVKYFKDGQFAWNFDGRSEKKLLEFMNNPTEPPPPPPPQKPWNEEESSVVHLTDGSFKNELKKKKHVLVMFYAPWCGHCKHAKPHFTAAAARFADDAKVMFAAVDCTVERRVCDEYSVKGFPTFIYSSYLKTKENYNSGREEKDFVAFMNRHLESKTDTNADADLPTVAPKTDEFWAGIGGGNVVSLTADTFQQTLTGVSQAIVMFYAPWCGHCKTAKSAYAAAADKLKHDDTVLFAAIDCVAQKGKCFDEGVKGYPTFRMYENGKFKQLYKGGRGQEDFARAFGTAQTEESFFTSEYVTMLDGASFEPSLTSKEMSLVMFFAPWCKHCKEVKSEFSAAALNLRERSDAFFAAVNCEAEGELCAKLEVDGYPAFKLFKRGVFDSDFKQGRSTSDFIFAFEPIPVPQTSGGFFTSPRVLVLNEQNFEKVVKGTKKSLVMFFSPTCKFCLEVESAFSAAADEDELVHGVLFGGVDCTKSTELCKEQGVDGFPTIIQFKDGGLKKRYDGEQTKGAFLKSFDGVEHDPNYQAKFRLEL